MNEAFDNRNEIYGLKRSSSLFKFSIQEQSLCACNSLINSQKDCKIINKKYPEKINFIWMNEKYIRMFTLFYFFTKFSWYFSSIHWAERNTCDAVQTMCHALSPLLSQPMALPESDLTIVLWTWWLVGITKALLHFRMWHSKNNRALYQPVKRHTDDYAVEFCECNSMPDVFWIFSNQTALKGKDAGGKLYVGGTQSKEMELSRYQTSNSCNSRVYLPLEHR